MQSVRVVRAPRNRLSIVTPLVASLLAAVAATGDAQGSAPITPSVPTGRVTFTSTPAIADLLARAVNSTAMGDTNAALDILERAGKTAPNDPNVLYWRGMLLSRSTHLSIGDVPRNIHAWRLLDKGADLDPKNARYLLEMGRMRLRTPMLRLEAERLFSKALKVAEASKDPVQLAEVAYELGQIKERRYLTSKDRYLITSPGMAFNPDGSLTQIHYTREFLASHTLRVENAGSVDRAEAEEYYRRGVRAMPLHEPSALGLARILYDQQRYPEMERVLMPFVDNGTGSAHVRLAAGLAAYRGHDLPEARRLFDDALTRFSDAERRDATTLSRIIRRREAQAYDALSDESKQNTDSAYWESADPLLSTPENEGRLEFLARVALADLRFTDPDTRTTGWKTDRGLILIRYGEPPVVAVFPPIVDVAMRDAVGRLTTLWFYPQSERQFVFTGPAAMNYAMFAGSMRGIAEELREDAPFLLENLAVAANLDSLPTQIAAFRGDTPNQSRLVIAALFNTDSLYSAAEFDRSALAISLRTGAPSKLRLTRAETLSVDLSSNTATKRVWTERLPSAGRFRVRVEALDEAVRTAAARSQMEIELKAPVVGILELSDILIADRLASPPGAIKGLDAIPLSPRASLTLRQRDTVSVYWETYGAKADASGRVKLDIKLEVTLLEIDRSNRRNVVQLLGGVADFVGLTPEGDSRVGVTFSTEEALAGRDRVPQITTIGLGSSPAGRYRLEIRVTDRNTGTTSRTERIFYMAGR